MANDGLDAGNELKRIVTRGSPLGPSATEELLGASVDTFRHLYDTANLVHLSSQSAQSAYVVGRKGAGKTAFLIGATRETGAEAVLIRSADVYDAVNRLRLRYTDLNGTITADTLVHAWEVLLLHAAMWGIAASPNFPPSYANRRVRSYIGQFGRPQGHPPAEMMTRVAGFITAKLASAPDSSFSAVCWGLDPGGRSLAEATAHARTVMESPNGPGLCVVVDNLEDLHVHLEAFAPVISALFRVTTRMRLTPEGEGLPFKLRFAFPAELLSHLRLLAANPEKDFNDHVLLKWTAAELISVVGNRVRLFLDLYVPTAPRQLGLPRSHDHADRDAASRTLRAVLPDIVVNGFGRSEDPLAYLLRHTQLLPRQLIEMLNAILSPAVARAEPSTPPLASVQDVLDGVRRTERNIVDGALSSYQTLYPAATTSLKRIKNHCQIVEPLGNLRRIFNNASGTRAGIDFDEFLSSALAIGALGIVTSANPSERYVRGEFAYTFADAIRPVEATDSVCIHPLFMRTLFDQRALSALRDARAQSVYPFGADPADEAHEL